MSLADDIEYRCSLILDKCPEKIVIPDRAQSSMPATLPTQYLNELSQVVWLVVLDMFARQIKHYDQVGSPKSRGAIVIRLSMILDLSDRLKRYGLAKPTETSDRVLERVRGLVTSYYEAGHNPYNTSDNCYYRNLCRESSIGLSGLISSAQQA